MNNREQLDILMKGREAWKEWRSENLLTFPRLIGANLAGADLRGYNFLGSTLIGVDFTGANLSNSLLNGAILINANLSNAILIGANLDSATLSGAILDNTNFENCSMGGVIFQRNDLSKCLGLDTITVELPASIDYPTLKTTESLPINFLKKLGFPESFIRCLHEWS